MITLKEQIAYMKGEVSCYQDRVDEMRDVWETELETCKAILQSLESLTPTVRGEPWTDVKEEE